MGFRRATVIFPSLLYFCTQSKENQNHIITFLFQPLLTRYILHFSTSQVSNPSFSVAVIKLPISLYSLQKSSKIGQIMSSSTKAPTSNDVPQPTANEVPLHADPITTVFPDEIITTTPPKTKSKKKKSKKSSKSTPESQTTTDPKKKERKLKRGECRFPLNMHDLMTKDDPFHLEKKGDVESSKNPIEDADVEAFSKATNVAPTKSNKERG
jgi:hypothetical protein